MDTRKGAGRTGRAIAVLAALALAISLLAAGCGGSSVTTTAAVPDTFAGAATATAAAAGSAASALQPSGAPFEAKGSGAVGDASLDLVASSDRKIIGNATLMLEVAQGKFQMAFSNALLLADKYGGYIISSDSTASGEEDVMRSGTVALRVPEKSFPDALADATALGKLKSQKIETQDVTEEYVDLQARLTNAQTQEKALTDLMDKAKNVQEVLQVQQYLAQTQQEIEQLKGRLRFLDEHTSYSTITMNLYEVGAEQASTQGWGFTGALSDALHAFVGTLNSIVVGLGGALPALVLVAILAYIAYRIARPFVRRSQERQRAQETRRYGYAQPQEYYAQTAPSGAPPSAPVAPKAEPDELRTEDSD